MHPPERGDRGQTTNELLDNLLSHDGANGPGRLAATLIADSSEALVTQLRQIEVEIERLRSEHPGRPVGWSFRSLDPRRR